ncbi:MAG: DMT family transporter [Pseudomonadota bacterium]
MRWSAMLVNLARNPAALLLIVGGLGGVNFILGKLAADAGISPLLWALLISGGAAWSIAMIRPATLSPPKGRARRYVIISGLVSFALANWVVYALIPILGAGYVGLMFALSPVATLGLSIIAGTGRPKRLGLSGIAIGLFGAILIVVSGGEADLSASVPYLALGLLIPVILAVGNVYRTLDWPDGSAPDGLAVWSHGVACLAFLAAFAIQGSLPVSDYLAAPWLSITQVLVAGLTFPAYFQLQKVGGPVLLSQIGYVSAAVGLAGATLVLGERYQALTWGGAAVVAIGIALTIADTQAKRAETKADDCTS